LCISTIILLGFALVRYRRVVAAKASSISMFVFINSETNQITVIPNQHTWAVSNFDSVSHRFEFTLPREQIQEIYAEFGREIENNVISGPNATVIVERYLIPLIETSPLYSLFLEIFNSS